MYPQTTVGARSRGNGSPASAPAPSYHPGCLAVFSETEQEVGLHNVRIQEAIGLLKATSCELVIHIHLSPAIRPFGALPLSTGAAIAWGPPSEALGHRMYYCAELAAPHRVGRKVVGKKGTPALHCHSIAQWGWGLGSFLVRGSLNFRKKGWSHRSRTLVPDGYEGAPGLPKPWRLSLMLGDFLAFCQGPV